MKRKKELWFMLLLLAVLFPQRTSAMHIMEGFLEPKWCILWGAVSLPFVIMGFIKIQKSLMENPNKKLLLGLAGAFMFVLSALKLPSVTGSCSHPTGAAMGAILFGPTPMAVLGVIVLLFQAIFLAHGGLTTLGANVFSMAIVGPFVAYYVYQALRKGNRSFAIFAAAFLGDLLTYVTTSIQLAMAYPDPVGGFMASFIKFGGIFAVTQIPLAIGEGILTLVVLNIIAEYNKEGGFQLETSL